MSLPDILKKEPVLSQKELPIEEVGLKQELPKVPKELNPWIKQEQPSAEELRLPEPVTNGQGETVLDNIGPQQVTVELPLTKEEMKQASGLGIKSSARWLREWGKRLLEMTKRLTGINKGFIYKPAT